MRAPTPRGSWSRVLAALGVLLLASAAVSALVFGAAGARALLAAKVALGAALLAAGAVGSGAGGLRRFFTGRAFHYGLFTALSAVLLAALLAVGTWAAYQRPLTLDLTRNRIWSLSDDTARLLRALDQDVEALAFYGPADGEAPVARRVLEQYAAASPRFHPRLVDPVASPELVRQYALGPGGPRLVLTAGGRVERAAAPTEEELSNALSRLAHPGRRRVYVTQGHGEPAPADEGRDGLAAVVRALAGRGDDVTPLTLAGGGEVPADAAAVLVVAPRAALLEREVAALGRYLARGGRLGAFVEPQAVTGLEPLLAAHGMELDDDLVLDGDPAAQAMGGNASTPVVQPVQEHPVTRALAAARVPVILNSARSLSAVEAGGQRARPLLLTAPSAWGETDLASLGQRTPERGDGEKGGPMPVALADERPAGEGTARVVVVGDGDLPTNRMLNALGNRDFVLGAVGWLVDTTPRLVIRPRTREAAVAFLTEAQATSLAVLSVDLVPLLLLGAGLAVWLARRGR